MDLEDATYIIGIIGLNDAIKYLSGFELHESDKALEEGLKVISAMFLKTKKMAVKHKLKVTLEETPAESASRRLAKTDMVYFKKDAARIVKGSIEQDTIYYTNSVHVSPDAPIDLVDRIRTQAKFHSLIESGAITHAFIGEETPDADTIYDLVRRTFYNTQSAQLTISPEFTYCRRCDGITRGLQESCPNCGSEDVVGETRVVGYFSKVQNWNKSKREGELLDRQNGDYSMITAAGSVDQDMLITAETNPEENEGENNEQ